MTTDSALGGKNTHRYYIDEDSWTIVMVDRLGSADQLLMFQESHLLMLPSRRFPHSVGDIIYDFENEQYSAMGLVDGRQQLMQSHALSTKDFKPRAVSRKSWGQTPAH